MPMMQDEGKTKEAAAAAPPAEAEAAAAAPPSESEAAAAAPPAEAEATAAAPPAEAEAAAPAETEAAAPAEAEAAPSGPDADAPAETASAPEEQTDEYQKQGLGTLFVGDTSWKDTSFTKPDIEAARNHGKDLLYLDEKKRMYNPCTTSVREILEGMGIGIGLYLQMLKTLTIVFALMTLYAVPAFIVNGDSHGIVEGADPLYFVYYSLGNQGLNREVVDQLGGCQDKGGPVNCVHAVTVSRCGWVAGEPCFNANSKCKGGSDVCIPQVVNTTLTSDPIMISYWLSLADFMYSAVFLIFIVYFKIKIRESASVHDQVESTMTDFSLMVKGFPPETTEDEIRDFFSKKYALDADEPAKGYSYLFGCLPRMNLRRENPDFPVEGVTDVRHLEARMGSTEKAQKWEGSWVADVAIITPIGLHVRKFLRLQHLWQQVLRLRAQIKHTTNPKAPKDCYKIFQPPTPELTQEEKDAGKKPHGPPKPEVQMIPEGEDEPMRKKLAKLEDKLSKLYHKVTKMQKDKGMTALTGELTDEEKAAGKTNAGTACHGAFVVFNNEESKDWCAEDYASSRSWFGRFFQPKVLRFSRSVDGVEKFYKLKVTEPPEPSNVQWEYLDTSDNERTVRIFLSNLAAFALICASFVFILIAHGQKKGYENKLPNLAMCEEEIPAVIFGGHSRVPNLVQDKLRWNASLEGDACAPGEYYLSYVGQRINATNPAFYDSNISIFADGVRIDDSVIKRPQAKEQNATSWTAVRPKVTELIGHQPFCFDTCIAPSSPEICPTLGCLDAYKYNTNMECSSYPLKTVIACYCSAELTRQIEAAGSLWDGANNLMDSQPLCVEFVEDYMSAQMLVITAAVMVILVNTILKEVLKLLSVFEHHESKSAEAVAVCSKVFIAQFINTALIVLLVNMSLPNSGLEALFATGDITGFNHDWYTVVGVAIMLNMAINIVVPHAPYLAQWLVVGPLKRMLLAKKADTQHQLDSLYEGPEFEISTRFPLILNSIFTCMFYCGGLPILLPFASISFGLTFIVDIVLLLRLYRKPPQYDERLAEFTVSTLPLALCCHLGMSFWMYGNDMTLASDGFMDDEDIAELDFSWDWLGQEGFAPKFLRLNCLPIFLFCMVVAFYLFMRYTFGKAAYGIIAYYVKASYLIWKFFWRTISCGKIYGGGGKVVPGAEKEKAADKPAEAAAAAEAEGDDSAVNTTASDIALDVKDDAEMKDDGEAPSNPEDEAKRGPPTYTGAYFAPLNAVIEVTAEQDFLHKFETVLYVMGDVDRTVIILTFFTASFLCYWFVTPVVMLLFAGFLMAIAFVITAFFIWWYGKGIDVDTLMAAKAKKGLTTHEKKVGWVLSSENWRTATMRRKWTADSHVFVKNTAGQYMLTWQNMGFEDHSYRIMDQEKYRDALKDVDVMKDAVAAANRAAAAAAERKAADDAAAAAAAAEREAEFKKEQERLAAEAEQAEKDAMLAAVKEKEEKEAAEAALKAHWEAEEAADAEAAAAKEKEAEAEAVQAAEKKEEAAPPAPAPAAAMADSETKTEAEAVPAPAPAAAAEATATATATASAAEPAATAAEAKPEAAEGAPAPALAPAPAPAAAAASPADGLPPISS